MSEVFSNTFPAPLDPSADAVSFICNSIQTTLRSGLPNSLAVDSIAPLLTRVNQWSTQLTALFEGNAPHAGVNLVFSIRKDLFVGPPYLKTVFGTSLTELPAPFHEFLSFTSRLIEIQKPDKEKTPLKVFF